MGISSEQLTAFRALIADPTKRVSIDGTTTENQSGMDLIRMDRYFAGCLAAEDTSGKRPFRLNFFNSPGAVYGVGKTS